eukprot:SAG25_NODE_987_length_4404_cov_5.947735_4_plen_113_part_00
MKTPASRRRMEHVFSVLTNTSSALTAAATAAAGAAAESGQNYVAESQSLQQLRRRRWGPTSMHDGLRRSESQSDQAPLSLQQEQEFHTLGFINAGPTIDEASLCELSDELDR